MKRLPPKHPAERIVIAFNFKRRLGEGVTMSAPVVTATVASGTDGSPGAIVSGAAMVLGTRVLQLVINGNHQADYRLLCEVDTSDGQHFVLPARLPVRNS